MHPLVDLHCHLDLYPNPISEIRSAGDQNAYILSVTTTPKAWRTTARIAAGAPRIKTSLGLHPQLVGERAHEIELFEELLPSAEYVGEIGLDGSREFKDTIDVQVKVFRKILQLMAKNGGRIASIHSRGAASETLDELEKVPDAGTPILRWFSGSKAELQRAIDFGCWFSVGPAMLRSRKGLDLAKILPPGRVLTETDGPFGKNGKEPLRPAEVGLALKHLSNCWGCSFDDAGSQVVKNLRCLMEAKNTNA